MSKAELWVGLDIRNILHLSGVGGFNPPRGMAWRGQSLTFFFSMIVCCVLWGSKKTKVGGEKARGWGGLYIRAACPCVCVYQCVGGGCLVLSIQRSFICGLFFLVGKRRRKWSAGEAALPHDEDDVCMYICVNERSHLKGEEVIMGGRRGRKKERKKEMGGRNVFALGLAFIRCIALSPSLSLSFSPPSLS